MNEPQTAIIVEQSGKVGQSKAQRLAELFMRFYADNKEEVDRCMAELYGEKRGGTV